MRDEPTIHSSAYKHGVEKADIVHALGNPMFRHWDDEDFTMIVGPARNASLIEVGYVLSDEGGVFVIHAMSPARPKYLR